MTSHDPVRIALFLLACFVVAGCAQVAWLASPASQRFARPLDGGRTFRGRRLLGANKTMRGVVVMVPAAAVAFAAIAQIAGGSSPEAVGLWAFSALEYAALGAWAGVGFMAGELPNSFVKRQLGIAPGAIASHPVAAFWQFAIDRVDSGLGMLAALSLVAPVPWQTWGLLILVGWAVHWPFSLVLYRLRVKARPA